MKKRMKIMIIALSIVFGGIILFNIVKGILIKRFFAHFELPAVTVSSVTAAKKNWKPRISAVGNFVAINGVDVNSEAAGNVVAIHFESGQYVEKDSPLIDIDDHVEQATLKANQSELALQEINYKRQADLFKRGATPSSSLDESRAKLLQAQAEVEKTNALIRQKHITAPFSGRLGIRQVNLGQYITPGQNAIVTLQSLDPLFLEFYVPEQLLNRLHIDQLLSFSVEQYPRLLFQGKITAINAKVDPTTHNIQVQATLLNCPANAMKDPTHSSLVRVQKHTEDNKILVLCDNDLNKKNKVVQYNFIPGMFAAIEVEQPVRSNVVVLPTTAISYSLYGNSVYVIEQKKDNDKANQTSLFVQRVFVDTGDQQGNYTVIKKGVEAGQQVVSSGELKLQDGTRVVINNSVRLEDTVNPEQLSE